MAALNLLPPKLPSGIHIIRPSQANDANLMTFEYNKLVSFQNSQALLAFQERTNYGDIRGVFKRNWLKLDTNTIHVQDGLVLFFEGREFQGHDLKIGQFSKKSVLIYFEKYEDYERVSSAIFVLSDITALAKSLNLLKTSKIGESPTKVAILSQLSENLALASRIVFDLKSYQTSTFILPNEIIKLGIHHSSNLDGYSFFQIIGQSEVFCKHFIPMQPPI